MQHQHQCFQMPHYHDITFVHQPYIRFFQEILMNWHTIFVFQTNSLFKLVSSPMTPRMTCFDWNWFYIKKYVVVILGCQFTNNFFNFQFIPKQEQNIPHSFCLGTRVTDTMLSYHSYQLNFSIHFLNSIQQWQNRTTISASQPMTQ